MGLMQIQLDIQAIKEVSCTFVTLESRIPPEEYSLSYSFDRKILYQNIVLVPSILPLVCDPNHRITQKVALINPSIGTEHRQCKNENLNVPGKA
jgi:hypothetical protein